MNAAQTLLHSWMFAPKRFPPALVLMGYDPLDYKFPFALRGTPRKMHMDVTRGKRKRIAYLNHCARVIREQIAVLDRRILVSLDQGFPAYDLMDRLNTLAERVLVALEARAAVMGAK